MTTEPGITAILVAYNNEPVIGDALACLMAEPKIVRILMVDNCSTDDTIELIRRDYPNVEIIENPRNIGFGPAANVALEKVTTPYALVAEPATAFSFSVNTSAAIAGHSRNMLLCMDRMRRLGFFDPRIFMFFEYEDLCKRAELAGYEVIRFPEPQDAAPQDFFHERHRTWSKLYMEEKYSGTKSALKLARKWEFVCALAAAFYRLKFDNKKTECYRGRLQGIFDFKEAKTPAKIA